MLKQRLAFLFCIGSIVLSCSKGGETIDVTSQWKVDANGSLINGLADGQWQPKTFTSELLLFESLDTANLTGTTKPDSVITTTSRFNCIIPNPFKSVASFSFNFSNGFNGEMVFKFVVVNNHMDIVDKGAVRIQGTSYPNIPLNPSTSNVITLSPAIPAGKYRIYFTLSAESNPHFYQCWGNIQKTQ
ncbi:MAG TPA: hypothetical protein VII28_06450 [Puia sp.]